MLGGKEETLAWQWVQLFDLKGRLVKKWTVEQAADIKRIEWDCMIDNEYIASGLYFLVIESDAGRNVYKIVIVK